MEPRKSSWKQELERRSNDILKVFNPWKEDHVVQWDKGSGLPRLFRVPAEGEAHLVRYIAEKYIGEMVDWEITHKADTEVKKHNEERIKKGMQAMTKWQEQEAFESPFLSITDEQRVDLARKYYGGVVTQFGVDSVASSEPTLDAKDRTKRPSERMMDKLYEDEPVIERPELSTEDKKKQAVERISKK